MNAAVGRFASDLYLVPQEVRYLEGDRDVCRPKVPLRHLSLTRKIPMFPVLLLVSATWTSVQTSATSCVFPHHGKTQRLAQNKLPQSFLMLMPSMPAQVQSTTHRSGQCLCLVNWARQSLSRQEENASLRKAKQRLLITKCQLLPNTIRTEKSIELLLPIAAPLGQVRSIYEVWPTKLTGKRTQAQETEGEDGRQ